MATLPCVTSTFVFLHVPSFLLGVSPILRKQMLECKLSRDSERELGISRGIDHSKCTSAEQKRQNDGETSPVCKGTPSANPDLPTLVLYDLQVKMRLDGPQENICNFENHTL